MAALYELHQSSFIHIQKQLDQIDPDIKLLDGAELERHKRFLDERKKNEFLVGRCFIKRELASLLGIMPDEVALSLSANGKPQYVREGEEQVHFNLSHGSGHFVLGFSLNPIGVDLEKKREVSLEVMQPILSDLEAKALANVPDELRSRSILSLFTIKEAFIKSTDKKYGLDEISFDLKDGYWQLISPQVNCSLQHIEHKELIIAVSVYSG